MTVSAWLSDSVFTETHGLENAVESDMNENACICLFVKCRVSAGTRKRRSKRAMLAAASIANLTWHELEPNMQGEQFFVPMANLILCFQSKFCGHIWAKDRLYTFKICSPERSDYTQ